MTTISSPVQLCEDGCNPGAGLAHYAFKTAFQVTKPEQIVLLEKSFGTARFAYNWALSQWEERRQQGEKTVSCTAATAARKTGAKPRGGSAGSTNALPTSAVTLSRRPRPDCSDAMTSLASRI